MYSKSEIEKIYERHINTVYRTCFIYFKEHTQDLEDCVQNVFIKLLKHNKPFTDENHERAWLIVVARNICKDTLRSYWKRNIRTDELNDLAVDFEVDETIKSVMALKESYKICVYLHYYMGYAVKEIAAMLNKSESAVTANLYKGRQKLKEMLGEEL